MSDSKVSLLGSEILQPLTELYTKEELSKVLKDFKEIEFKSNK